MFLSLLFKSIKADHSPQRIAAMTKRLMQVAVGAPAHFAAGALLIVSELIKVGAVWVGDVGCVGGRCGGECGWVSRVGGCVGGGVVGEECHPTALYTHTPS